MQIGPFFLPGELFQKLAVNIRWLKLPGHTPIRKQAAPPAACC